jgi:hypothetical protein
MVHQLRTFWAEAAISNAYRSVANTRTASDANSSRPGTPINVVTRLMRHSDSKTTLNNYAHSVRNSERDASERLSKKIEDSMAQLESTYEMESTPLQTI